jgi:hypothetical protein
MFMDSVVLVTDGDVWVRTVASGKIIRKEPSYFTT